MTEEERYIFDRVRTYVETQTQKNWVWLKGHWQPEQKVERILIPIIKNASPMSLTDIL